LQRQDLQLGVIEREPVRLVREAGLAGQQTLDHAYGFILAIPLRHGINAKRVGVGCKRTRTGSEDGSALTHVVELHDALRHVERVMIGQRDHAGTETDTASTHGRAGQEHLGRGNCLPAGAVVLTAPKLLVAELVHQLDQLKIALQLQRRALARKMVRS
jgi:hypothetical protein